MYGLKAKTTSIPAILAIDDSEDDLVLLQAAFRSTGAEVDLRCALNGEEGLEALAVQCEAGDMPNLVLLDLNMPRMNGFEVLQVIRKQPRQPDLLTIVFSSSRHHQDVRRAYAEGVDFYLMKPLDFAGLAEVVKAIQLFLRQPGEGEKAITSLSCFCSKPPG